jgi:hypothetical protein
MPWPLITEEEARRRIGTVTFDRCLDDDNVGEADPGRASELLLDVSSMVLARLTGVYPVDQIRSMADEDMPRELKRIALNALDGLLSQLHPEVMQGRDWEAMLKRVDADLIAFRKGETGMGTTAAPEPPANVGGEVLTASGLVETEPTGTFLRGFGDY